MEVFKQGQLIMLKWHMQPSSFVCFKQLISVIQQLFKHMQRFVWVNLFICYIQACKVTDLTKILDNTIWNRRNSSLLVFQKFCPRLSVVRTISGLVTHCIASAQCFEIKSCCCMLNVLVARLLPQKLYQPAQHNHSLHGQWSWHSP